MGRAEVKAVAGLDGVGEGDAASDDARPGLFKTEHHGTARLYQAQLSRSVTVGCIRMVRLIHRPIYTRRPYTCTSRIARIDLYFFCVV